MAREERVLILESKPFSIQPCNILDEWKTVNNTNNIDNIEIILIIILIVQIIVKNCFKVWLGKWHFFWQSEIEIVITQEFDIQKIDLKLKKNH